MEVLRRRQNTYGKATKKILVHDLFDTNLKNGGFNESFQPPTIDHFVRTRTGTPLSELSEDPETSRQLNYELQATLKKSRSSSEAPSACSARSQSVISATRHSPAVFEIHSSEGETRTKKPVKTYKRRKLVGNLSVSAKHVARTPSSSSSGSDERCSPEPKLAAALQRNKTIENKALISNDRAADLSRATVNPRQAPLPMPDPKKASPQSYTKSQRSPIGTGSPSSDKSIESMHSTRSTPKRKRATAEEILSDVSSPSQLELASLRLTPNNRSRNKAKSIDLEQSDSSLGTPSRNRRRLVDKLDSPRAQSKTKKVDMKDLSPRPAKTRKVGTEFTSTSEPAQSQILAQTAPQLQLQRDSSSRTSSVAPKTRTYGKQRSHLQDTVSTLPSQNQPSSQDTLQRLVSQVESRTQSQDAFEIESEDDEPGTKLKSIHELRQAGLANRSDRDLETILEDIESDNKSLRIQGLMQLVRKLQEQAYKRQLLESGKLYRLTSVSKPDLNLTTASVLLLAFWALAVSEVATAQALSQIYAGIVKLPIQIIHETRPIFRIARDRKENLSKALVRDLGDLETHIVDQSLSAGRQPSKNIIISRVALRSLEYVLKRLIELAEPVPEPSVDVVDAVVSSASSHTRAVRDGDGHVEHIESIRLLVLWLEMTAATSRNTVLAMNATQLTSIAETLAGAVAWARAEHPLIEQSCIRSAVEFSNGNGLVCDQFAQTDLLPELFEVVERHFAVLNGNTNQDQNDETRLDSVILALGCLLNLMDHSPGNRSKMMDTREGRDSQMDALINFFKQHADETEEAISEAQIQLLIPFGYVVLLLCTLCLDDSIKHHVASDMEETGMRNLVSKAEIFLSRMQAVDSDSFVERFGATIGAVKESLVCA